MDERKEWEVEEFYVLGDLACCILRVEHRPIPGSYFSDKPFFAYPKVHWNGYVGVPRSHPWWGVEYDDVLPYPAAHGGLTYSERECTDREYNPEYMKYLTAKFERWEKEGLDADTSDIAEPPKHIPIDPQPAYPYETGLDLWWFGFDTVHGGDWNEVTGEPIVSIEHVKHSIANIVEAATEAWRIAHVDQENSEV